ncbi:hypothetical protein AB595_10110, partial [Massilia sp. WF1]
MAGNRQRCRDRQPAPLFPAAGGAGRSDPGDGPAGAGHALGHADLDGGAGGVAGGTVDGVP